MSDDFTWSCGPLIDWSSYTVGTILSLLNKLAGLTDKIRPLYEILLLIAYAEKPSYKKAMVMFPAGYRDVLFDLSIPTSKRCEHV